ncbi:MAG: hypothetical protein V1707_01275 [bacterium]
MKVRLQKFHHISLVVVSALTSLKTEEDEAGLKVQMVVAKSADEMIAIATKMKKFVDEGRDEDVLKLASLAREKGLFNKNPDLVRLTKDLAESLKKKNPDLYKKLKF